MFGGYCEIKDTGRSDTLHKGVVSSMVWSLMDCRVVGCEKLNIL